MKEGYTPKTSLLLAILTLLDNYYLKYQLDLSLPSVTHHVRLLSLFILLLAWPGNKKWHNFRPVRLVVNHSLGVKKYCLKIFLLQWCDLVLQRQKLFLSPFMGFRLLFCKFFEVYIRGPSRIKRIKLSSSIIFEHCPQFCREELALWVWLPWMRYWLGMS